MTILQNTPIKDPYEDIVQVPSYYWDDLNKRNIDEICDNCIANPSDDDGIVIDVFNDEIHVDFVKRELFCFESGSGWNKINQPLLELVTLVYLLNASDHQIEDNMISVKDLKDAHFFQGPHQLKTGKFLKYFGNNPEAFKKAAEKIGGIELEEADAGFTFHIFPKIPIHYLLWCKDDEFPASVSVLFDKSIEHHLAADGILGAVSLVSDALTNNFPFNN